MFIKAWNVYNRTSALVYATMYVIAATVPNGVDFAFAYVKRHSIDQWFSTFYGL